MRLIDADSLTQHMQRAYEKRIGEWDLLCTVAVIGAEEEKEIVRCKDCKYWRETHDNDHQGNHSVIMECYYDQWHPQYRDADDFCSKGERRGKEI